MSSKKDSKINNDLTTIVDINKFNKPYIIFPNKIDIILLNEAFNNNNHLNKFDLPLNNFYWHINKIISESSFSTCYLREDKFTGNKAIILQKELKYIEDIKEEKYILQKIHDKGNFPPLYEVLIDNDYCYFIEGLMGFFLQKLFYICIMKFDLFTVMNIGIDVVTNLKILHENGYIHRDLKPGNLSFVLYALTI
jgi:serine/threonine protein kinase